MTHHDPTRPKFGYVPRDAVDRAYRAFLRTQTATDVSARVLADYVLDGEDDLIAIRAPKYRASLAAEEYAKAVWEATS